MRVVILPIVLLVAACSSSNNDDLGGRLLVAPGSFDMSTCLQMANRKTGLLSRQRALEDVMRKAGDGVDGRLVSAMAYQPEYMSNQGYLDSIRRTEAEKGCKESPVKSN